MTEFKNDLISKIMDKFDDELFDYMKVNWGSGLYPSIVEQIVFGILKKELRDVIVIDKTKFKENLKVVATNKTIGDDCYLARRYNIGLNMCQYIPVDSVCDAAINHIKEEFISRLEECDF